jgi:hypothetical protein
MDHIQGKTDSNPDAVEEALSTVSKQVGELEWKQFIQKELVRWKTNSNPDADEEAFSDVSKQEIDSELKQFIQKELDKPENQEKDVEKEDSDKSSSAEKEFTLSSIIEHIPIEEMINSGIRFINKKTEPEKTEPKNQISIRDSYLKQENDIKLLLNELKVKKRRRDKQRHLQGSEAENEKTRRKGIG